jgi:lysozyme
MKTSPDGLTLIKRFEGFSATPYRCPAGLWTIGYGHVVLPDEMLVLTSVDEEQAVLLLARDASFSERAVAKLISWPINQAQFDALVSFTFNLGAGALQRSTLRRVINRGEESGVAEQWLRFIWGAGRKLPGLMRRRRAELALYQA